MSNLTIIIFGVSGDLAKKKLIPAIYHLLQNKKIEQVRIIGVAYDEQTPETILAQTRAYISAIDESTWQQMHDCFTYQKLNFTQESDYELLRQLVIKTEQMHDGESNRLIYLATAAHYFCPITNFIAQYDIAMQLDENNSFWHRIVYEKPFGSSVETAHAINECIARLFNESQIFRIDHFLTKDLVNNISLIRFANCLFEPLWNNRYIEQVHIILDETIGIDMRGSYYDHYGALADVVQNHMLELLALVAMEAPEKLSGDYVRMQRAQVLQQVEVVDGFLGQYEGYTHEQGVAPHSKTETFAMLRMQIDNPRWHGVPFFFKTGKKLDKRETSIYLKFRQVDCMLLRNCPTESNWLCIEITPRATFKLSLNVKKPGRNDEIVSVPMEYCHSCVFAHEIPESYEVLIEEIMHGELSASVRFDEIEHAWRIIEDIKRRSFPLYPYKAGSNGPAAIAEFEKDNDMRWR